MSLDDPSKSGGLERPRDFMEIELMRLKIMRMVAGNEPYLRLYIAEGSFLKEVRAFFEEIKKYDLVASYLKKEKGKAVENLKDVWNQTFSQSTIEKISDGNALMIQKWKWGKELETGEGKNLTEEQKKKLVRFFELETIEHIVAQSLTIIYCLEEGGVTQNIIERLTADIKMISGVMDSVDFVFPEPPPA